MNKNKKKSGTIKSSERIDAWSAANHLLEKVKRKEKNKIPVRVDKNTIILVDDSLTAEEISERIAMFRQEMENNKSYF